FVGDVKQAIYRWRNSDWNILANEVNRDYSNYDIVEPLLDTNWRSSKDIIEFNNKFFSFASETLQESINSEISDINSEQFQEIKSKITDAYSNIEQKVSPKNINNRGRLAIHQIEKDENIHYNELAVKKLIEEIDSLLLLGYNYSDITILVRKNSEGVLISNALLSHEKRYPVISNTSLLLANSIAIQLIVAQLEFLTKPYDSLLENFIKLYQLSKLFEEDVNEEEWTYNITKILNSYEYNKKWEEYKTELFKHQQKPLYNLVEAIITLLPEHIYNQGKVYIKAFSSIILDFINNENADINQFIEFWNLGKNNFSLTIPEDQNAIKIYTIHKSKGLEFKAVIVPFVNWNIIGLSGRDTIWLSPNKEPFNEIGYLPIKPKKDVINHSHFANDYLNEKTYSATDTLNACYVAFTRAEKSLSIIIPKPKENKNKKDKQTTSYSDLISDFSNIYKSKETVEYQGTDKDSILFGKSESPTIEEATIKTEQKRSFEMIEIEEYKHISIEGRIENHLESKEHFSQTDDERDALSYGKLMHDLFENIKTTEDIDRAIIELQLAGKISANEIDYFKDTVT
ncbi:MAG: hypothetical protein GX879_09190, partial [Bacteroidales bacterium]|nr:hypothetical protein [Bacteroidales bacterium]